MYRCLTCLNDFINFISFVSLDKKISKVLDAKFGAGTHSVIYFTHRPLYAMLVMIACYGLNVFLVSKMTVYDLSSVSFLKHWFDMFLLLFMTVYRTAICFWTTQACFLIMYVIYFPWALTRSSTTVHHSSHGMSRK